MVVDTIWSPASRVVATVIDRISSNSASFFKIDIPQVFSEPDVSRFKIIYQFVDCEYQGNPTSCNLRQFLERCRRDLIPKKKKKKKLFNNQNRLPADKLMSLDISLLHFRMAARSAAVRADS